MTTKKAYRVIMAAIAVAAIITVVKLSWYRHRPVNNLSTSCFQTEQGWGFNIMSGQRILIHQPMMPGKRGNKGFDTQQQAAAAAQEMIADIRNGRTP